MPSTELVGGYSVGRNPIVNQPLDEPGAPVLHGGGQVALAGDPDCLHGVHALAEGGPAADLVEDLQAVRQHGDAGADLWREVAVRLEEDIVDVELLQDVCERQPADATADDNSLEAHFGGPWSSNQCHRRVLFLSTGHSWRAQVKTTEVVSGDSWVENGHWRREVVASFDVDSLPCCKRP